MRLRRHAVLTTLLAMLTMLGCKKDESSISSDEAEAMTLQSGENCGTPEPTPAELRQFYEFSQAVSALGVTEQTTFASIEIPVYVWVIRKGETGAVPKQRVDTMIGLLNERYSGTRYSFRLAARTEITDHPEWYSMTGGSAAEKAAKLRLRKGGRETLNVWTAYAGRSKNNRIVTGYARRGGKLDGVVIIPANVTQTTAVHEVGHWLGLMHTFEGGCGSKNDGVADTPAQKSSTDGCPQSRDSCPSPGFDPFHNYMDYSRCRNEFSLGQRQLVNASWPIEGRGVLMFQRE